MHEISVRTENKPLSLTNCRISTGLWRRLASEAPADLELAEIVASPALHAEAKALIPALAAVAAPCGPQSVRAALQPLVLIYGVGEAAKSAAFWKVYIDALAGLPAEALAQAVIDYAAQPDAEWFPKPGPLKALASKRAEKIWKAYSRAKRAAAALPSPTITKADSQRRKAEVAEMLKTFTRPQSPSGAAA